MIRILKVEALGNYKLFLVFEDGRSGTCDISPFLDKGAFRELKDESLFRGVFATPFSVEWPNEIDLSSDTLLAIMNRENEDTTLPVM
ncbi:MAG: DUF2442 domain-containing protein [Fibrobacterota bacterium]